MLERQRTRARSGGGDLPASLSLKRTAAVSKKEPSGLGQPGTAAAGTVQSTRFLISLLMESLWVLVMLQGGQQCHLIPICMVADVLTLYLQDVNRIMQPAD